jgi:hypothetical protein
VPAPTRPEPTIETLTLAAFFDEPRRRGGKDVGFGDRWRGDDDPGARYNLYWLEPTGECYLTRLGSAPIGRTFQHPFTAVRNEMTVEVLAGGLSLAEVNDRLDGWHVAMDRPDSVRWLRLKLHTGKHRRSRA